MRIVIVLFSLTVFGFANTARPDSQPALQSSQNLKQSATTACDLYAYVIDPDPKGLNVRNAPNNTALIRGRLKPGENGVVVHVTAASANWLKIEDAEAMDDDNPVFEGSGWVFAQMLATSIRSPDAARTPIYKAPSKQGGIVTKVPAEEEVKLVGCRGGWAKVAYNGKEGWLPPESQCGNPVTTCP